MTWNGWDWYEKYNASERERFATSLQNDEDTLMEISATSIIIIESPYGRSQTFPAYIIDTCYLVPVQTPISPFLYLKRPFTIALYIFLAFLTPLVAIILYKAGPMWFDRRRKQNFFDCFQSSFCAVLNLSTNAPPRILRWSAYWSYMSLFIFGLIISSYYNTFLASSVTTLLYDKEIETFEDMKRFGRKILNTKSETDLHMRKGEFLQEYRSVFKEVDDSMANEIIEMRDNFNTSYAYSCVSDRWTHFRWQQNLLNRKIYKWTDICWGRYYAVFPMMIDNHLEEPFKYFNLVCRMYGLFEQWSPKSFRDAVRMKVLKMVRDDKHTGFSPLDLDFFFFGWCFLSIGLGFACIVFALEYFQIWSKLKIDYLKKVL